MVFEKKMGLNVTFKNYFLDLLDFVFPNFCVICNQKINRSIFSVCSICISSIEKSNAEDLEEFYNHNLASYNLIKNFYSTYEFVKDGIFQQIVHQLKYNGKSNLGILLGRKLGEELLEQNWFQRIDFIVPVPIHRIKKLKRGYNQSSFIVKGISKVTKKPFNERVIKRIKNTETQTHLHLQERIENVKNAFKVVDKSKVANKNILIVDDVCTTGSTVNEVARTLLDSGAREISLATLAFVKERDFSVQV